MNCRSAQAAIDEHAVDEAVRAHIDDCTHCTNEQRIDVALRATLVVEAPPDLSARLLALATAEARPSRLDTALERALVLPAPPELSRRLARLAPGGMPMQRTRRPWVMPVYAMTTLLLSVVLVLAGQVYGLALEQLGISELWRGVAQLPSEWLHQLQTVFPQAQYLVTMFFSLQRALQWVLAGLLMWAVLELRTPQRARQAA